ncbi:phospho-acceptor domain-containing protein [Cryobacterium psychrophilum]|nr:phospho-acceptor domain-containing protein [Cryobacterium psychrophilum]
MVRRDLTADERLLRRTSLRLALQFSALIVAIVALVGLVAFAIVSASIQESMNRALTSAAQDLRGDEAAVGTYVITMRDGQIASGKTLPEGLPDRDALRDVTATRSVVDSTVESDGTSYSVRTRADKGLTVQVAIDRRETGEEIGRLLWSLVIAGIVGAVAAGGAGYLLSRHAMKPLIEALALQRRFVADASHELRTPLTLLSTRVQMLRRALAREDRDSALAAEVAAVEKDTKALTGIVEDLLVAADTRDVGMVDVDLGQLADDAVGSVVAAAQDRSLSVDVAHRGDPAVIQAVEAPLRRVYLALLANALDHAVSTVAITITGTPRLVTVEVTDDGPGFPVDTRPFERFSSRRPPMETSRHYGLGLALVADVVARFGGRVAVVTDRPGGIVRIELPRG